MMKHLLRVKEAPQSHVTANTPTGVFFQVHLIMEIAMMGEGLTSAFGRRFVPSYWICERSFANPPLLRN
jgi:hypothetical protein